MPRQHENDPRMNRGELHQISAEIGGLKKSVEMLTTTWSRQEEAATAGRKALHEKVEMVRQELGVQVASLGLRVDRLADQVQQIEPTVSTLKDDAWEHEKEQLREEGAARWRKRAMAGLTAVAGVVGYGIHEVIGYFKH